MKNKHTPRTSPISNLLMCLRSDEGYYISWKANISMAIYDELCRTLFIKNRVKKKGSYLSKKDFLAACDKGADVFLQRLLRGEG